MLITRIAGLSLASLLLWTGCSSSTISGHGEGTAGSSGATSGLGSGTATATSGGRTTQAGGSSSGTGSSTGSSSATSSTSAGSSTGRPPAPPIVDGGYVFCEWPAAPPNALKRPGSASPAPTSAPLSGDGGNCFQCRSDADCTNEELPTYDPNRLHCDSSSGVAGHQGFCQHCVSNADCAGNPAGPVCNLNESPGSLGPAIDLLGFETCGGATIDCLEPSAPACGLNQTCNPADGICTNRSPTCLRDADCTGYFASQYVPAPYCSEGMCSPCPDVSCGTGCTGNQDCGDAGLTCFGVGTPYSFCGLSCAAPEAPACPADLPRCDADSGLCRACTSDDQCPKASAPTCAPGGFCACTTDDECPSGQVCFPRDSFGNCAPPPEPGCTPGSCDRGDFCDWQSGTCVQPSDTTLPFCITDYDCSTVYESADFCVAGKCVQCRDDNDCVVSSYDPATNSQTFCSDNKCPDVCESDADCIGSWYGPTCVLHTDAGYGECQEDACTSDADCAGNPLGSYCDFDGGRFYDRPDGTCDCLTSSDCGPGMECYGGYYPPSCSTSCASDAECPPGYSCDLNYTCRPRCDDGGQCSAAQPICDQDNAERQNGEELDGSVPGLVWCYGCLTSDRLPGWPGCSSRNGMEPTPAAPARPATSARAALASRALASRAATPAPVRPARSATHLGSHAECPTSATSASAPSTAPDDQGCNSATHTCGTCTGPTSSGGPFDCPPGDFCSDYWSANAPFSGACLQTCDARPCPADHPICAQLPPLSNDHLFCFGCLQDADCADAGPGAWCDTSVGLTFTCQLPVGK